ncbi:MAG: phosphate acetyltransferase, partial [Chloroflexota bacterium]
MNGIYVSGIEPRSGKAVVLLGMMEVLSGRLRRVGFFRPLVRTEKEPDGLGALIATRYAQPFPYEDTYGCTYGKARELLTSGREDDLYTLIIEKYKALESRCDAVLCGGTDYRSVVTTLEFDYNVALARNLGLPMVPVLSGQGKNRDAIVDMARAIAESLEEAKCDVLGLVVNRVDPDLRKETETAFETAVMGGVPVYVLPEVPILGKPTVREIARTLEASVLSGGDAWLDGDVRHFKIAAMELPNFLDHLDDGSLVVAPGDRSDIILGTLVADMARTYPRVAGLLLTGDIRPAPQVQRLLDGLDISPVPVLSVPGDTFTTAMKVNAVEPSIAPENGRKIAAAIGMIESSMNVSDLLERATLARPDRMTPIMFQYGLIEKAKKDRRHIVLPEGTEERVLRAAEIVLLRGICDVTLLGNVEEVRQKISSLGLSLESANVIDPLTSEFRDAFSDSYFEARKHKGISPQMAHDTMADGSYFGTMMVHLGHADGMVSGAVHTTAHTIRPALEFVKTKPGVSIISSVFFMCLADRVLVYGDCAINPEPTAEQLADIAISSAATAQTFGVEPRVAMLSYSTGESGKGPEVDKVREATRIAREQRPDLKIEGPIQYDAAIDAT